MYYCTNICTTIAAATAVLRIKTMEAINASFCEASSAMRREK